MLETVIVEMRLCASHLTDRFIRNTETSRSYRGFLDTKTLLPSLEPHVFYNKNIHGEKTLIGSRFHDKDGVTYESQVLPDGTVKNRLFFKIVESQGKLDLYVLKAMPDDRIARVIKDYSKAYRDISSSFQAYQNDDSNWRMVPSSKAIKFYVTPAELCKKLQDIRAGAKW